MMRTCFIVSLFASDVVADVSSCRHRDDTDLITEDSSLLQRLSRKLSVQASRAVDGCMTMWSSDPNVITGSHCGYAASNNGGLSAASAQSSYIQGTPRLYCAIHNDLFNGGEACGKCFKLRYDGGGFGECSGTVETPSASHAGEAVIQVVDSGGGNHDFDCVLETFDYITGWNTDRFPVTYEEVDCEVSACDSAERDCVMTLPTGNLPQIANGYLGWARVVFHNLHTSVKSVTARVGQCPEDEMTRSGALWDTSLPGSGCYKPVIFTASLSDDTKVTVDATEWPEFSAMKYCTEVTWHPFECTSATAAPPPTAITPNPTPSTPTTTSSPMPTVAPSSAPATPKPTPSTPTAGCEDEVLPGAWTGGGIYDCRTYLDLGNGGTDYCAHDDIAAACCFCKYSTPATTPLTEPSSSPMPTPAAGCEDAELPSAWTGGGIYDCRSYLDLGNGGTAYCAHADISAACCFCK